MNPGKSVNAGKFVALLTPLIAVFTFTIFSKSFSSPSAVDFKTASDLAPSQYSTKDLHSKSGLVSGYGRLPLSFEANFGQADAQVKFLSRGNGYTLFLTPTEAVLALKPSFVSR